MTDLVTMVGMFKEGNIVLGSSSLVLMLIMQGVMVWYHERGPARNQGRFSCARLFSYFTFSSNQYFVYENFLRKHRAGRYDRRSCEKENDIDEKKKQLFELTYKEKGGQNASQFILQIINIAPYYSSISGSVGAEGFWYHWKQASLLLTVSSLTRTCVSRDWFPYEHTPLNVFSFRACGKGWKAIHPQKWILFVLNLTHIISRVFTVTFLILLVNHDFSVEFILGSCSLSTVLSGIRGRHEPNCSFLTEIGWLLFLYGLVWWGFKGILESSTTLLTLWDSLKLSLSKMQSNKRRMESLFCLVVYFLRGFMNLRSRLGPISFTETQTNHLPNVKKITFLHKVAPSLLQATGTVVFTIIIYVRGDERFDNIDIGIRPLHFAFIGIGIETTHLIFLLLLVYRADPQHVKSLSDEKIVTALISMGEVDDKIDVSCSKSADLIIRDVIEQGEKFSVLRKKYQKYITKNDECDEYIPYIRMHVERSIIDSRLEKRVQVLELGSSFIPSSKTALLQYSGIVKLTDIEAEIQRCLDKKNCSNNAAAQDIENQVDSGGI